MTNLNRITALGNTGKGEPKTGSTANGTQVTRLRVATNKRYRDSAGAWQTEATWHNIVVYGPNSAEYAAKIGEGSLIFVEGEMSYREYEREVETTGGLVKVSWPHWEIVASSISVVRKNEKRAAV